MRSRAAVIYSSALLLLSLVAAGCLEKKHSEGSDPGTAISTKAPSPAHKLDILFGKKLRLVGYDTLHEEWKVGEAEIITWHWKVEEPIDAGWKLFTHVADPSGTVRINADKESPIRRTKPLSEWPKGSYVADEQTITLPEEWRGDKATFLVGVYKGKDRMRIEGGAQSSGKRARAAEVRVRSAVVADVPIPSLESMFTAAAPKLDGVLDEAAWNSAPKTAALVNTMTGRSAEFEATVKSVWDNEAIYFAWEVEDDLLKARSTQHDEHLWKEDCVEIMVDPDGDGRNYFELQVSPRGVTFETRYDSRRVPKPYGHVDWESGITAAAVAHGKVDDFDKDEGYTVEIRIPWTGFAHGDPPATPPTTGSEWRVNFYAMDEREKGQRSAGWSATLEPDFHVPARFGRLNFKGGPAAAPAK
jgi:hypothetical protein